MIIKKKNNTRDFIRQEIIRATSRVYGAENYKRWGTFKIYPQQIKSTWELAYKLLADSHPKMEWLQMLVKTPSKDITLKLVLRIPDKNIEIDLPDQDRKLGAIAHAGGIALLTELLEIVQNIGKVNIPVVSTNDAFNQAIEFMEQENKNEKQC